MSLSLLSLSLLLLLLLTVSRPYFARGVYLPLVSNTSRSAGWPEVMTKEVLSNLHKMLVRRP